MLPVSLHSKHLTSLIVNNLFFLRLVVEARNLAAMDKRGENNVN